MRIDGVQSATHNVYAYRFVSSDGIINEGFDDDGEHGTGRQLFKTLVYNKIKNSLMVVSDGMGARLDRDVSPHVNEAGQSTVKKLPVSV